MDHPYIYTMYRYIYIYSYYQLEGPSVEGAVTLITPGYRIILYHLSGNYRVHYIILLLATEPRALFLPPPKLIPLTYLASLVILPALPFIVRKFNSRQSPQTSLSSPFSSILCSTSNKRVLQYPSL